VEVTRTQQGAVAILALKGPMLAEELGILDGAIDKCVGSGLLKIVLDLEHVPFIDSVGLEKILSIVSAMSRLGGNVHVASANSMCRDIFRATRMDGLLQVFENRDETVRSLL
jgi:anti-sigma B factor antagonist